MRQPLIAGNWKMHGSRAMLAALTRDIITGLSDCPPATVVVFPSHPYLAEVQAIAAQSPLQWGGQDMSSHPEGAYTGDVSAKMLLDFGCRYALLGHSERRQYHGETDQQVADKVAAASAAGLIPMICIGETAEEYARGETQAVLARQLAPIFALSGGIAAWQHAIIAYEPVWAIGSGLTATPEVAQSVHAFIRQQVAAIAPLVADTITLLYGGSVKANNARDLLCMPDIDGALVGGASLKAAELIEIVKCIK